MAEPYDPAARATAAYANAFQAGQALRARAASPPAAPNAMTGGPALGDLRARIAALNPEQKIAAGRQAEMLGAIGRGLSTVPYGQRRSVLAHMTPALAARGVAPELVSGFDPTDQNLAAAVRSAEAIGGLL